MATILLKRFSCHGEISQLCTTFYMTKDNDSSLFFLLSRFFFLVFSLRRATRFGEEKERKNESFVSLAVVEKNGLEGASAGEQRRKRKKGQR